MREFVMRPLQIQSVGQTRSSPQKQSILLYIGFQEEFDTPPLKPTKSAWAQFQQVQLTPCKTSHRYTFSHSPLGQGAMSTNLLHVIAPRMEPSNTQSS